MTKFDDTCARLRIRHSDELFNAPCGDHLINAFNNGERYRVKVRTTYPSGETMERWGYVSITCGWTPSFMLMKRRGQIGSSDLLNESDAIVDYRWIK